MSKRFGYFSEFILTGRFLHIYNSERWFQKFSKLQETWFWQSITGYSRAISVKINPTTDIFQEVFLKSHNSYFLFTGNVKALRNYFRIYFRVALDYCIYCKCEASINELIVGFLIYVLHKYYIWFKRDRAVKY